MELFQSDNKESSDVSNQMSMPFYISIILTADNNLCKGDDLCRGDMFSNIDLFLVWGAILYASLP